MNIMTNLSALNAARQQGIHSSNFGKSTEKLSSGFKINRAADGAAELGISEQMRAQIRGLNRSVTNADEGQNFIQTGDGAMNEIHDMLQRMRELSVQAINDTNTEADRAALAKEFDALQSEIDRVNTGTYFNTQPVFQEHEDSFYQIGGNRKWKSDQLHTITAPQNDLIINLPDGYGYNPKQYSLTVPNGTYTTQELVDEIEDAFAAMNPENPGFNLEFDQYGFCNLNFEDALGNVTKVQSVDGALAYLIYDCYSGSPRPDITGTSIIGAFSTNGLKIEQGKNDTLQFYLENGDRLVTIKVPADPKGGTRYSRDDLIDEINRQLRDNPLTKDLDLEAAYYDYNNKNSSIQLTGSGLAGVTGLKGNMFNIEHFDKVYTGAFYDNISSAHAGELTGILQGAARFTAFTEPLKIMSGFNDQLKLELSYVDENFQPQAFTFTVDLDAGDRSVDSIVKQLNDRFQTEPIPPFLNNPDPNATVADYLTARLHTNGSIILETKQAGNGCYIKDASDNPLTTTTFNTLFKTSTYTAPKKPIVYPGSGPTLASVSGRPSFPGSIDFPAGLFEADRKFIIQAGGVNYSVTIPDPSTPNNPAGASFSDMNDLCNFLNTNIAPPNPPFTFVASGGSLNIEANDGSFSSFSFPSGSNAVYQMLLCGQVPVANRPTFSTLTGEEFYGQGDSTLDRVEMDSVTFGIMISTPVTVDNKNDVLDLIVNGSRVAIPITNGTYNTAEDLIRDINQNIERQNLPIEFSLNNGRLQISTKETGVTGTTTVSPPATLSDSSGWQIFTGTHLTTKDPIFGYRSDGAVTTVTGVNDFKLYGSFPPNKPKPVEITGDNNTFTITFDDIGDKEIELSQGYYTIDELVTEVQKKIDAKTQPDQKLIVSNNGGCLQISAKKNGAYSFIIDNSTKFYQEILGKPHETLVDEPHQRDGYYSFDDRAYIVGRAEIAGKDVEIIEDVNDTLKLDFTYTPSADSKLPAISIPLSLDVVLPEGKLTNQQIKDHIEKDFNKKLETKCQEWSKQIRDAYKAADPTLTDDDLDKLHLDFDLDIAVNFGKDYGTAIEGVDPSKVLSFQLVQASGKPPAGSYTIDGIRGSAAYSIFYSTTDKVECSYAVGSKDITDGITFEPGKTQFAFTMDGKDYTYTFPEIYYSPDQFIAELNSRFENGDDNGNPVNLKASIENGSLKIMYKGIGDHSITDIRGDAKALIFYKEDERDDLDPFMLQVGALGHQGLELNRFRVNTMSLGINTVTVSRVKYAEKALDRLDKAIDQLSTRRSTYGALQNRIDFLKSNNKNAAQNVQASESKIRDANMAKEMIDHVKNQITTQASESVLAQANQLPNRIANLLFQ